MVRTGIPQRTFWREEKTHHDYVVDTDLVEATESKANLISSLCVDGGHAPAIDIDLEINLAGKELAFTGATIKGFAYADMARALRRCRIISKEESPRICRNHRNSYAEVVASTFRVCAPTRIIPSRTEGHFHLFFDIRTRFDHYLELLRSFERAGIVQNSFVSLTEEEQKSLLYIYGRSPRKIRCHDPVCCS